MQKKRSFLKTSTFMLGIPIIMQILFSFSFLLSSRVAALLVSREEYLTHTLFKDSDETSTEHGCDDCCDKEVCWDVDNWSHFRNHVCIQDVAYLSISSALGHFLNSTKLEFQVLLKDGIEIKFFGKKYNKFWPCANGLISFNGEVYTSGYRYMKCDLQQMCRSTDR